MHKCGLYPRDVQMYRLKCGSRLKVLQQQCVAGRVFVLQCLYLHSAIFILFSLVLLFPPQFCNFFKRRIPFISFTDALSCVESHALSMLYKPILGFWGSMHWCLYIATKSVWSCGLLHATRSIFMHEGCFRAPARGAKLVMLWKLVLKWSW